MKDRKSSPREPAPYCRPDPDGEYEQRVQDELDRPPIAGAADPEYQARIDADRVTEQWKHPVDKREANYEESPLFGGLKQSEMF